MAELGDKAKHYHEEVGALAKNEGIDILYTLGQLSQSASEVYGQAGQHFHDIDLLIEELYPEFTPLHDAITILVKCSRSSRLDGVATTLEASPVGKIDRSNKLVACRLY